MPPNVSLEYQQYQKVMRFPAVHGQESSNADRGQESAQGDPMDTTEVTVPLVKRKIVKSRNGCMSCKRRKKKCDETKPTCQACVRNAIRCQWPEHVLTSLRPPPTKPVPLAPASATRCTSTSTASTTETTTATPVAAQDDHQFILDQFLDIQQYAFLLDEHTDPISNLSPQPFPSNELGPSATTMTTSAMTPSTTISDHSIPGVEMSDSDTACYGSFIKTILRSISYPHCDPSVSPLTLLLPIVKSNHLVRKVALACGASALTYVDSRYDEEAKRRYAECVNLIIDELKKPLSGWSEPIFVCVQLLQTLSGRDKNMGLNITICAAHFASAYAITKKRFLKMSVSVFDGRQVRFSASPLERLLVDYFILHYPLSIMLCRVAKLKSSIPSPFRFFEQFGHVLNLPLHKKRRDHRLFNEKTPEDAWLDHPVLGIGARSHEIAAKCAWICRFLTTPISEDDRVMYFALFLKVGDYLRYLDSLLAEASSSSSFSTSTGRTQRQLTNAQRCNIHYCKSVLYACLVILKKLCNYEQTTIEMLRDTVQCIITEEKLAKQLDLPSTPHISSIWTLFVGASAASTHEQKAFFAQSIKATADQLHSSMCLKILKYLKIVWQEPEIFDHNEEDQGFEESVHSTQLDEHPARGEQEEGFADHSSGNSRNKHVAFEFLFNSQVLDIID